MSHVFVSPDIECDGCANAVKKGLGKQAGVTSVAVDVPTKKVTVEAGSEVSRGQIAEALKKMGFPPKE